MADFDVTRIEISREPAPKDLREELAAFWNAIFQATFSDQEEILAGGETAANRDVFYLLRQGAELAATCQLTISRRDQRIGGLSVVATHPAHRGRGLASRLVESAVQEFEHSGGQALWLGTVNPAAAKVYERCGFQHVPGSKVMLRAAADGDTGDWFREAVHGPIEIVPGGPQHRLTMIPLILTAHPSPVLDGNCQLLSTRIAVQVSCMGLYPRYRALDRNGGWFVAESDRGTTVGLASVQRLHAAAARIDAFVHPEVSDAVLRGLYLRSLEGAAQQSCTTVESLCPAEDARKTTALTALGFQSAGRSIITVGKLDFEMIVFNQPS